jgi:hypothetical protein
VLSVSRWHERQPSVQARHVESFSPKPCKDRGVSAGTFEGGAGRGVTDRSAALAPNAYRRANAAKLVRKYACIVISKSSPEPCCRSKTRPRGAPIGLRNGAGGRTPARRWRDSHSGAAQPSLSRDLCVPAGSRVDAPKDCRAAATMSGISLSGKASVGLRRDRGDALRTCSSRRRDNSFRRSIGVKLVLFGHTESPNL